MLTSMPGLSSLAGLAVGLLCVPLLAWGRYDVALAAILFNRLLEL